MINGQEEDRYIEEERYKKRNGAIYSNGRKEGKGDK